MYKVIHNFADNQDGDHVYLVGDIYPREGYKTTLERATYLMSSSNKIGVPLIEDDDGIMAKPIGPADAIGEEKPKKVKKTVKKGE